jgi:hypothetical protein
VPKTVVGETHEFVGAGPETMLLKHVQEAVTPPEKADEAAAETPKPEVKP